MNSRTDNSDGGGLWRRFAAAEVPHGPCPDELTLASYLDGRLEARHVEAVEAHLAGCAACRSAAAELRGMLAEPALVMPPAELLTRAAGLVAPSRAAAGFWRRAARWSAVAAAVVVVAWGGFAAGRKTYNDRQAVDQAVARQVSFGLAGDGDGDGVVASVDAFDEMLLAGGDAQ